MGVFDGSNKTPTRIDLSGDSFAPNMGALAGSGFTEDVLIHGTLNQMVQSNITRVFMANETITINGNRTATVMGSQTLSVMGNQTETVMGSCLQTILGMLTQAFISGQNTSCVGPHNRTDASGATWLCPAGTFINSGDLFETKIHKMGAYAFRFTGVGADVAVRMSKTDMSVNTTNVKPIETRLQSLQSHMLAGMKNTAKAALIAIEMARSDINGAHPEIRAVRPAVGVEVSAPPTSMPGAQ